MALAVKKATAFLAIRMHLRPIKKIKFTFDPYTKDASSIRDVASTIHTPSILESNQGTVLKFDIRSDRKAPQMDVEFNDGHQLVFKTKHLTELDILDRLFDFVDEKDPRKNEGPELVTKSTKASAGKGGKGKKR